MMTIYHNPRCSKSREALALVRQFSAQQNLPLQVVEYLKTPLTFTQLTELHRQLGGDVHDMVRDNEEEFSTLNLAHADHATLLHAIAQHPVLLQRPIVSYRAHAAIGRPLEKLQALLHLP